MGRPSKLSPAQWREIARRVAEGESAAAMSREYGVSQAAVSKRVSKVSKELTNVAKKLADARREVAALPAKQQHDVERLADRMLSMGRNLAAAGDHGAATARHLAELAERAAMQVTHENLEDNEDTIKAVGVLGRVANEQASIALQLATLPKERSLRDDDEEDDLGPTTVVLRPLTPLPSG